MWLVSGQRWQEDNPGGAKETQASMVTVHQEREEQVVTSRMTQAYGNPSNRREDITKKLPTQNKATGQYTAPAPPPVLSTRSKSSLASTKSHLMAPGLYAFLTHGMEILKALSTGLMSTRNWEPVWSYTHTMHIYTHIAFMCSKLLCG